MKKRIIALTIATCSILAVGCREQDQQSQRNQQNQQQTQRNQNNTSNKQ